MCQSCVALGNTLRKATFPQEPMLELTGTHILRTTPVNRPNPHGGSPRGPVACAPNWHRTTRYPRTPDDNRHVYPRNLSTRLCNMEE